MKKLIFLCIAAWFFCSCSSSDPSIMDATSSDNTPVTGQKILLQVRTLSDHYPMTYAWDADNGTLDAWTPEDNYVYWTAPENPASTPVICHVTCTVTDDDGNTTTHTFTLTVAERLPETLYSEETNGITVVSMEKEATSSLGGVWISLDNEEVHYINSTADSTSTWTGTFGAMAIAYSSLSYSYALWGAPPTGNVVSEQSDSGTSSVTFPSIAEDGVIHSLLVSIADPGFFLLAGSDSGLHYYYTSTEGSEIWHDYTETGATHDLCMNADGTVAYAAADQGVFSLTGLNFTALTEIYDGAACAVHVDLADGSDVVWRVTGGIVCQNDLPLPSQPPVVVCSLDTDTKGRVWCGKYYWDGSAWHSPSALDPYDVDKVAASAEGLMYFLTGSGAFLRY